MTPSDLAAIRDRVADRRARWEWGTGEYLNATEGLLEHVDRLERERDRLREEAARMWQRIHASPTGDGTGCAACDDLAVDPCPANPYRSVP